MLKTMIMIIFAFIGIALLQGTTWSQSEPTNLLQTRDVPQGLMPGTYPLYVLINNPRVIGELQLTEVQLEKWDVVRKQNQEIRKASDKSFNERSGELREKLRQSRENNKETTEAHAELDNELTELETQAKKQAKNMADLQDRKLLNLLEHKQATRLKEIRLQAEGPKVFEREEVRIALDLLPEQVEAIKRINFQYMKQLRQSAFVSQETNSPKPAAEEGASKKLYEKAVKKTQSNMAGVRVSAMGSIENVLGGSQRKIYKKMIGENFDFLNLKGKENEKKELLKQESK